MFALGVVPYLNAVPLVADLEGRCHATIAVPSALSGLLARREVDAALLPVAEALGGVGDGFLGPFGITSEGPVASVLLFLRKPLEDVRRVVLDPASRSSAGMARWLVARGATAPVRFETAAEPGTDPRAVAADAVLLIGDPALTHAQTWGGPVLDLGAAWTDATGLPFVYARWTVRKGLEPERRREVTALLGTAAESGIARREALARAWADTRGVDPEAAARYVREHVGYRIGAREEAGLARYAEVLREVGASASEEAHHA